MIDAKKRSDKLITNQYFQAQLPTCNWCSEHSSASVQASKLASQVVHAAVGDDRVCTGPLIPGDEISCASKQILIINN